MISRSSTLRPGKYAFVNQGSWIGATMTGDDKDAYEAAGNFKCGMIPYAWSQWKGQDITGCSTGSFILNFARTANAKRVSSLQYGNIFAQDIDTVYK